MKMTSLTTLVLLLFLPSFSFSRPRVSNSTSLGTRKYASTGESSLIIFTYAKPHCDGPGEETPGPLLNVNNVAKPFKSYSLNRDLGTHEQIDFSTKAEPKTRKRDNTWKADILEFANRRPTKAGDNHHPDNLHASDGGAQLNPRVVQGLYPECAKWYSKALPKQKAGCYTLGTSATCYRLWGG